MPVNSILIKPDRTRAIYHQGEYVTGKIIVDNKYELKHEGLMLSLEGQVDVSANFRNLNFLDTFNGTSQSIPMVQFTYELIPAGRLQPGQTEVPFKILLDESVDVPHLYETYHGVFISIQYFIKCRIKRPLFFKDLIEQLEFVVEYDSEPIGAPPVSRQPIKFEITPRSLTSAASTTSTTTTTTTSNTRSAAAVVDFMPNFKITGQLDSLVYRLSEPITGEYTVEMCDSVIRSVELQLVRVETYGNLVHSTSSSSSSARLNCNDTTSMVRKENFSRDATEVQNIQIGDGDILRNMPMSIHMVLPRLFTCPTLITNTFKIEFEVNLVIIFDDNHLITENFPIKLIRSTLQPID